MFSKHTTLVIATAIICMAMATANVSHGEMLEGITAPSADITLSFVMPGRVSKVHVGVGATVKKDQPLIQLFDETERIQCQQLKMLSEDYTKIHAAQAELAQKRVDLKKVQKALTKGAASEWEVEHLNLNVRIGELALKSALLEQKQYRQRYAHAKSQLVRMRLVAPVAGLVEEVNVEVGESIGTLGPVVRIVQNDPLWIDVPAPVHQAMDFAIGQAVWVTFPETPVADASPNGRIIYKSAVADAASETLQIRIEVPNPLKRPAGERVDIAFSKEEKTDVKAQLDVN
ncbi:MAG: efflux RND transporter periplasmic adaptor subunit [Desulfobacterales bacterium]|nr:efflux RND transporter periplasmic adaptor subunit [Desulfobacterales bacterium]